MGVRLVGFALFPVILGGATVELVSRSWEGQVPMSWALWPLYALCSLAAYYLGGGHKGRLEPVIFPVVVFLTGFGIIETYRLRPDLAWRQFSWVMIGLALLVALGIFLRDYGDLQRYEYLWGVLSVVLLALTIVFGKSAGGARAWLGMGRFRFEPSEFVKIFIIIFLASYLNDAGKAFMIPTRRLWRIWAPELAYVGPLIVMWGLSFSLLILQKDLGAAFLFFGVFLSMLYVASGRPSYVIFGLMLLILGGVVSYHLFDHVRVRMDMWINPWADVDGRGYQIVQALFALGSGGIFGSGLGLGHPSVIPAVETDFVFASLCEELGFAAGAAIIALYLVLTYRGLRVALRARDEFGSLLATGLASLLGLQALTIIGGVLRLVPLTGVTMPFLSYGGSSLISSFLAVGLLSNVARHGRGADG
ncbi:MAG: FtsW/RodA/SpoVE family cell cycle protein [Firmicutes bacterium]|nr:FtsW/RodA/SpoVE family cell cycle protein [Bacillota bacterium]